VHALYNNLRHFLRTRGVRSGLSNAFRVLSTKSINTFLRDGRVITHLIDDVDKGLGIIPSETTDHLGRLSTRTYRPNEQNSFTLVSSAADQGLQGSFTRVEGGGWSCWFCGTVFTGSSTMHTI